MYYCTIFHRTGKDVSVEFCGGTHLHQSGHIVEFVITSEEAIAKGIRRMIALTGPEALKALKRTEVFENEINTLKTAVESDATGTDSKSHVRKIVELTEEIGQAVLPYVKKDEMRNVLKALKKTLDDKTKQLQLSIANAAVEKAKELAEGNPDAKFLVYKLDALSNTKALDSALKQVQKVDKEKSALFVSADPDSKKIVTLAYVPKSAVEKGLKANEWVQHISAEMGGKGGGKSESAQATGSNYDKIDNVVELARKFASSKLD